MQTLSTGGFVHDPDGIDEEKLAFLKELKEVRRGRISEYADAYPGVAYHAGARPWGVPCDAALPCATQNELSAEDAGALIGNGVRAVCEGANMPSESEAVELFREAGCCSARPRRPTPAASPSPASR